MKTFIVRTDRARVYEVQADYYRTLEIGTQFVVEAEGKESVVALFANVDVLSISDPKHVSEVK